MNILKCECKGTYIKQIGTLNKPIPEEKLDPKYFINFKCDRCKKDIWIFYHKEGG